MAEAFRRRAAELLGVPPDWILCGNGSDDILTIVTRTFVGQGQLLRLPYPSYILYKTLAQLQGDRSEEVPLQRPTGRCRQRVRRRRRDDLRLVFLANPNSPSGTVVPPEQVLEMAERLPCPLLVDEAYVDFADDELPDAGGAVREDHGLADAEQVVRPGRAAVRLPRGPAAVDRAVGQGEGLVQLRRPVDRRGHGRHRRPGLAGRQPGENPRHPPPADGGNAESRVCDGRFAGQLHLEHPSATARPALYEELKRRRILVRYMDYPGWGDGLRISVGTDAEIDALFGEI